MRCGHVKIERFFIYQSSFILVFNCLMSVTEGISKPCLANLEVYFRIVSVSVNASVIVNVPKVKMTIKYLSYESSFDLFI